MKNKNFIKLLLFAGLLSFISCEKEVSTSPPIEPVPIGFLEVTSSPPGMKIYEDGRNSGKVTPDSLNWLVEKQFEITLKKEYFKDTTIIVDIVEGNKQKLHIDYFKNPHMLGSIKCTSDPENSLITINDSLTEHRTPYVFKDLLPGPYTISYQHNEHRSKSKDISVKSDHETLAFLKLQDTSLWLDYRTDNSPLLENYVNCIEIDSSNAIWMGIDQYGLLRLKSNEWEIYSTDNSALADNYVVDLAVDDHNVLWIATYEGLTEKNGDNWLTYNTDNSILESNEITCLNVDRDNTLWIGTKNGLYTRSENGGWSRQRSGRTNEVFTYITAVVNDNEGEIWVGTSGSGIARYIEGRWMLYSNLFFESHPTNYYWKDMPSRSISAIIVEEDANRVWFGHIPSTSSGPGGISTYNQNTDKFSINSAYVPNPLIHNFYYDSDRNVWFCTEQGLVKWKTVHTTYFLNWAIKDIAVDNKNKIAWIATSGRGLLKLKDY